MQPAEADTQRRLFGTAVVAVVLRWLGGDDGGGGAIAAVTVVRLGGDGMPSVPVPVTG